VSLTSGAPKFDILGLSDVDVDADVDARVGDLCAERADSGACSTMVEGVASPDDRYAPTMRLAIADSEASAARVLRRFIVIVLPSKRNQERALRSLA
jgi:hypothetical protein